MTDGMVACLFPGQGAFYPGVLAGLAECEPAVRDVLDQMDGATEELLGRRITTALLEDPPHPIDFWLENQPDLLQVALTATSIVVHRLLADAGMQPDLLVGHSLGEIAALAAGGALTPAQAAEIVCHRSIALRQAAVVPGHMLALGASASRAQALVAALGDSRAVVAVTNHPDQTVVSGHEEALGLLAAAARELRMGGRRLNAPYPFHSPLLAEAAESFHQRIRHIRPAPLRVPVHSPIMGRAYGTADDLPAELASHLIRPVRFPEAVAVCAEAGVSTYVECGALDALTTAARRSLGTEAAGVTFVAPLLGHGDEWAGWNDALVRLGRPPVSPVELGGFRRTVLPAVSDAEFDEFWSARGADVVRDVQAEYARFARGQSSPGSVAARTVGPPVAAPPAAPVPSELRSAGGAPDTAAAPDPAQVLTALIEMYAEALEYPMEVFAADTELEAELGVDSVKQTELLARVSDRYSLPPQDAQFRLSDYPTLGHVRDLVVAHAGADTLEEAA
jgi:acyl transferase domain-containing protein